MDRNHHQKAAPTSPSVLDETFHNITTRFWHNLRAIPFFVELLQTQTTEIMNTRQTMAFSLSYLILFLFSFGKLEAEPNPIQRIEPPNWWVGMRNPHVQLMLYGDAIGTLEPSTSYPGVEIQQVIKVPSPNYLFVNLLLKEEAQPGTVRFHFTKNGTHICSVDWALWAREPGAADRKGFDNSDVLYLITPDRFANGNLSNDEVPGMREPLNRAFKGGRHGGDIDGIRQHLQYIKDMGFTAIWLNPVLENDMPEYSYHGYSTTDFYKVDPRFGTNETYRQLANEARQMGIDLIMDMIVNHCGLQHWWMQDLPSPDWINHWPTYTGTNHRKTLLQDPYASKLDRKIFTDGWFVPTMPDLNQRNPLLATYLTQNAIWWIEYLGLAGIRMDTYPYPDQDYMSEWTRRVMQEYPNFNVVGEEWSEEPAIVAYWQRGKQNPNGYVSNLPTLMDFPLQSALSKALTEPEGWSTGWHRLYETLALDFLYANPSVLVTFPDNHDMNRIFTQVNEDFDLFKMALVFVLTTRGTPQIYYGTEILMKNPGTSDHGIIRSDFPGGWPGDVVNGFTGEGLSEQQKQAKDFLRKLLHWRQTATAVHFGKLIHFQPHNGVYVFFRYDEQQKVMVVMNKNSTESTLTLRRFAEVLKTPTVAKEVISEQVYQLQDSLTVPPRSALVLEVMQ